MFPRILLATDFSQHAEKLVGCLGDLRSVGAEEVLLLNVVEPGHPIGLASDYLTRALEWKEDSEQRLTAIQRQVAGMGLRVRSRVEIGVPYLEIVRVAQEERVSLIGMGTHGRGFVKGVVLGSVTQNVVRHATVPVLVMKPKVIEKLDSAECDFVCQQFFHRVLLPTDFSPCADEALALVKRLQDAGTQEVIVLHVQDVRYLRPHLADRMDEFNRKDRERLERIRAGLEFFGLKSTVLLREGVPFQEIEKVAKEEDVSLIVIGSKGRSALADVMLGSVSDAVIRRHPRPVLVVRGTEAYAATAGPGSRAA
jgi:nucleotide-binding universal stress UspA family protein